MEPIARSIGPPGANGQRHRMLFHHIPLAMASVGLVVLFTMLPLFDVKSYEHADLMTGPFPQARASAAETESDTRGNAESRRTAHIGRTDHHGQRDTAMKHAQDSRPAESPVTAHGEARSGTSEHGRDLNQARGQQSVSLSRIVQQLTVATGYVGVGLLAITLLLG